MDEYKSIYLKFWFVMNDFCCWDKYLFADQIPSSKMTGISIVNPPRAANRLSRENNVSAMDADILALVLSDAANA